MKTLDALTAHQWIEDQDAILIDVREQQEFDDYRIDGAHLAPLSILPQAIQNIALPNDDNIKIIFQCLKGGRSAQAIDFLQENYLKDRDLYNLEGGILAWIAADLPVVKG